MRYISPQAEVSSSAYIGANVRIYGPTTIGDHCVVEDFVIIGKPDMYVLAELRNSGQHVRLKDYDAACSRNTIINPGCVLGTGTHIFSGTTLGTGVEVEDYARIGWDAHIGANTRIMYRAQVYVGVRIGESCRIAGYIADYTVIEDRVAFFGSAVHDYPHRTSTYEYRPSPHICADSIVACGAQIIGGVRIGENVYVGANAIVTRDVPDRTVIVNVNQHFPKEQWLGKLGNFDA